MGGYVTVSTKVRKELLEEAKRLGINVSRFLREALEEEVRRRRLRDIEKELEKMTRVLDKIDVEEVTQLIRRDRERVWRDGTCLFGIHH